VSYLTQSSSGIDANFVYDSLGKLTVQKEMKTLERIRNRLASTREMMLRCIYPPPIGCEDGRYSMILPVHNDDRSSLPTDYLMDISLAAIGHARIVDLDDVASRMKSAPRWPEYWPGEHYRLLAGLVIATQPRTVIEVGTFTGLSALALKKYLPSGGVLTTFDITKWSAFADTCLRASDFEDAKLVQQIGDLSDAAVVNQHAALISNADLIFVDAPKDGIFEPRFLQNLDRVAFEKPPLLVFDDIRLWNMLGVWRSINRPKIDLTSFGHWSGTGLVSWEKRSG
jgi:predicted O-methyltransferase YrrM